MYSEGGSGPAHQAGEPYIVSSGAFTPEGTGGSAIDPNSSAIFLLQSKDEVLMVREGPGGRRIHVDGRGHPDLTKLTPSLYGHSIGHYEGGVLGWPARGRRAGRWTAEASNATHGEVSAFA